MSMFDTDARRMAVSVCVTVHVSVNDDIRNKECEQGL